MSKVEDDNKIIETQEQKLLRFLEASGIKQMREDVDAFQMQMQGIISELGNTNQNIANMNKVLEQVVNVINTSQAENSNGPAATPINSMASPTANPMNKAEMIKELISGVKEIASAYREIKGAPQQSSFLGIDDNWIREEVSGIVREGLQLTRDINRNVKKVVTGKTTRDAMMEVISTPHTLE